MAPTVSFSARYQNILKISKPFTSQGQDFTKARSEAQLIEEQFLSVAATAEEYQTLCDDYVDIQAALQVPAEKDGETISIVG